MTDIQRVIANAREGANKLAAAWLRQGRSRWIETAIREGWSYNLEEMARSASFEHFRRHQKFPTLARLDDLRVNEDDHKYFRQHGSPHLKPVLDEIRAARSSIETARPMFGERE